MIEKWKNFDTSKIDWKKGEGLIPAIVQDVKSARVLMLGYVNAESLQVTLNSGLVTFFSRSRQCIWQKGETSGNCLRLKNIKLDCDNDTLLMLVEPQGPTCHTGRATCFGEDCFPTLAVLYDLMEVIRQRKNNPSEKSYTSKLFAEGITRIAQKVGEEGVEVALAAATGDAAVVSESADLIYHLLVLLEAKTIELKDVLEELNVRSRGENKKQPSFDGHSCYKKRLKPINSSLCRLQKLLHVLVVRRQRLGQREDRQ